VKLSKYKDKSSGRERKREREEKEEKVSALVSCTFLSSPTILTAKI